ncbi:MAG: Glu/Leu/Phe/Val dehydrogenase [Myxococcales bacterium]|nr:Glu/Leu/Phe/Val dehydrogenase [Myxococcales bacterium]USN50382.1 MAG: Glu/Leu/Phe/Val dehydrogenase [Myxococcales bacterium]
MSIFEKMKSKEHEQVVYCFDKRSGLKAIIAIHNTVLGPALGGCRMWNYQTEEDALDDVLRLSRGMTYKAAAAGLNLGGGKAVIIGESKSMKSESIFRAFGRFIDSLAGRYITAEDVGTTVKDMEWIRMETEHVTGITRALGGSGDPSPVTALGVYHGMRAALKKDYGSDSLKGRTVVLQGVGQVGFHLIAHLLSEQAHVVVSDIDEERIKRVKSEYESVDFVSVNEIYDFPCDIFAPCALGGTLNGDTIPRLQCKIVAGSANNVLAQEDSDCVRLQDRGITYVPDFVVSAGGLINVSNELAGYNRKHALAQAATIYDIVEQVLMIAENEKISTLNAAKTMAERRIESIANLKRMSVGMSLRKRTRRTKER